MLLPFCHLPTYPSDPLHSHLEEVTYWAMCLQLDNCGLNMLGIMRQKFLSLEILGHPLVTHAFDLA